MVDWAGFENRCAFTGTVGSNPTLSAIFCEVSENRSGYDPVPTAGTGNDKISCENARE